MRQFRRLFRYFGNELILNGTYATVYPADRFTDYNFL